MPETPTDFEGAFQYCQQQHAHRSVPSYYGRSSWEGLCQAFCHEAYGLHTGGFASAWLQWLGLDSEDRHITSDLSKAPLGVFCFSKGSTPFGHIYPAKRPFASGVPAAWSTDLWRTGEVGAVARTAPATAWGHRLLGWGTSINGYSLDLTHDQVLKTPPKPKQNKRYQRIQRAINNLEAAKQDARHDHDHNDLVALNAEIKRLEHLYSTARHS